MLSFQRTYYSLAVAHFQADSMATDAASRIETLKSLHESSSLTKVVNRKESWVITRLYIPQDLFSSVYT